MPNGCGSPGGSPWISNVCRRIRPTSTHRIVKPGFVEFAVQRFQGGDEVGGSGGVVGCEGLKRRTSVRSAGGPPGEILMHLLILGVVDYLAVVPRAPQGWRSAT